uniref:Uncharacterized protein n=1 Tax=Ditylenchus dipsaci TaxID=166011 RepID=A0A915DX19_9BILA
MLGDLASVNRRISILLYILSGGLLICFLIALLLLLLIICIAHHKYRVRNQREEELKQQKSEIKQQLEVSCVTDEGDVKASPLALPPVDAPLQEVTASSYSAEEKKEITAQSSNPSCEVTAESTSFNTQKKQPKKDVVPLPVSISASPAAPVVPPKVPRRELLLLLLLKETCCGSPASIKRVRRRKGVRFNFLVENKQFTFFFSKKRTTANVIQRFFVRQFTELSLSEGSDRDVEAKCDNVRRLQLILWLQRKQLKTRWTLAAWRMIPKSLRARRRVPKRSGPACQKNMR